ncbi:hypothetical protein [Duncaniella dubosii]|uniref:hypothetical protein n=1 Tax=Duncaniella dubosii TaxID=2518971 RepID=UPI000E9CAF4D|nr:hypothetical protein [Duncaniella dubosii]HBN63018.1 hypothetical protein [Porphyromonadaceae bacterium]
MIFKVFFLAVDPNGSARQPLHFCRVLAVDYVHFNESARRQQEQNRAEKALLDEKAQCLRVISKSKECINTANVRIRKVDEQLAKLQDERLNPQPTLFS